MSRVLRLQDSLAFTPATFNGATQRHHVIVHVTDPATLARNGCRIVNVSNVHHDRLSMHSTSASNLAAWPTYPESQSRYHHGHPGPAHHVSFPDRRGESSPDCSTCSPSVHTSLHHELPALYQCTPAETFSQTYDRLQARFASHATLSLDYRLYNLKQLAYLIQDNEPAIVEAIRQDLGKAPFVAAMEDVCAG
jgi:hypothetical protein